MSHFSAISPSTYSPTPVGETFNSLSDDFNLPSRSYSVGRIAAIVTCVTIGIFTCLCGAATVNPILIGVGALFIATGAILAITAQKHSLPQKQVDTIFPTSLQTPPTYIPQTSHSIYPLQPIFVTPPPSQPNPPPVYVVPSSQSRVQVEDKGTIFTQQQHPPLPQPIFITPPPSHPTPPPVYVAPVPQSHVQVKDKGTIFTQQHPLPQPISANPPPSHPTPPPVYVAPSSQSHVQVKDKGTIFTQQHPPLPQPISQSTQAHHSSHERVQTKKDKPKDSSLPTKPLFVASQQPPLHQTPKAPLPPAHKPASSHSPTPLLPQSHMSVLKTPPQTRPVVGDKKTPEEKNSSSNSSQIGGRVSIGKKH